MTTLRTLLATTLLCALPALAACGASDPAPANGTQEAAPQSAIGKAAAAGIAKARRELATKNITVGELRVNGGGNPRSTADDNRPKGEITPEGDFLVDGEAVSITPAQRALLLQHRARIIEIAEAGMEIGMQGADLAARATTEALKGVFSGRSEQEIERRVEAEAEGIKAAAMALCERLPALYQSQQQLAAALPEFGPYATMTADDIDDCRDEDHVAREEIRDEIRTGIRSSIQQVVQSAGLASRGTTDGDDAGESRDAAEAADAAAEDGL
jgi:hypothetical protein